MFLGEQGGCAQVSREEESSYCSFGGASESVESSEPAAYEKVTGTGLFRSRSVSVEESACRVSRAN
jgi:hypothetical protein